MASCLLMCDNTLTAVYTVGESHHVHTHTHTQLTANKSRVKEPQFENVSVFL